MKKLIIAAVVVCMAAITQAASVYWSCTAVYKDASNKADGVAYLMLESAISAANFKALAGKGASAINSALADALYNYTPGTAGTYSIASTSAIENSALGLSDSTDYGNAYLVIFDTASVTDASKFYVTGSKNLTTLTGDNTVSLAFGSQSAASKSADNWASAAAPEPTSGILLLLGMAGLALKRKRA